MTSGHCISRNRRRIRLLWSWLVFISPQYYWSPDIPLHQPGNSTLESRMATRQAGFCYHLPRGAFRIDRNALDDALPSTQASVDTREWIARLTLLISLNALAHHSLTSCIRRCGSAMVGCNLSFFRAASVVAVSSSG
jgi:hypothetical protein